VCREIWSASCPAARWCLFIGGVHSIIAERWTVADLDFLELSIRVATGASGAGTQQGALANQILGVGLKFDNDDDRKTERVTKRLAGLEWPTSGYVSGTTRTSDAGIIASNKLCRRAMCENRACPQATNTSATRD
jgi:hypothetical protein